jgi:biotin carboxylase
MAAIVIFEVVANSEPLIYEAKMLGHRVFVVTSGTETAAILERNRHLIDGSLVVDTNDFSAVLERLQALHARCEISAIIPGFEYYTSTVARLSALLDLPGLSPRAGEAVRHKDALRRNLDATDLASPRWCRVEREKDLDEAADYVGFPCILKPTSFAGSVHVSKVTSRQALADAYTAMCAAPEIDFGARPGPRAVVEAYIAGPEFSVEGVAGGGGIRICAVTEKLLAPEPFFEEQGHIVQADMPDRQRSTVCEYVIDVLTAIDFALGAFHFELRLSPSGPVVIEVNGRLPGDRIVDLVRLACGVSLPRLMIQAYLGHDLDPLPAGRTQRCAGIYYFMPQSLTRLTRVHGLEDLYGLDGFVDFHLEVAPNSDMPQHHDYRRRVAYAMFVDANRSNVRTAMDEAERLVSFE